MLKREFIYLWYYVTVLLEQIAPYWIIGVVVGSLVSVFAKSGIYNLFGGISKSKLGIIGIIPASILGIASPVCMYGTIPVVASFAKKGMREDWLAAFMMSSVLLNPQLMIYSGVLGTKAFTLRIVSSIITGIIAGVLVNFFYRDKSIFTLSGFNKRADRDIHPNLFIRLLKNIWRNLKATGIYFVIGIVLTALFQRYVPNEAFTKVFVGQKELGVLWATSLGVPLYVCGGGTVPLILDWLNRGMTLGAALTFMVIGPATKFTNLGALKIILGAKSFLFYIIFIVLISILTGFIVDRLFFY